MDRKYSASFLVPFVLNECREYRYTLLAVAASPSIYLPKDRLKLYGDHERLNSANV